MFANYSDIFSMAAVLLLQLYCNAFAIDGWIVASGYTFFFSLSII